MEKREGKRGGEMEQISHTGSWRLRQEKRREGGGGGGGESLERKRERIREGREGKEGQGTG